MPEVFSVSVYIFFKTHDRLVTDPDQTPLEVATRSTDKVSEVLRTVAAGLQSLYFIATSAYDVFLYSSTHQDPTATDSAVKALDGDDVLQHDAQFPFIFAVLQLK